MSRIIKEKQDLSYLEWSKIRKSSGTAGSYLKAFSTINDEKIYYKLSNYDVINGIIGHENINEIIVDRLLDIFGFEHLHYDLIHADILVNGKMIDSYVCASKDFKKIGEAKMAFDAFYEADRSIEETVWDIINRYGFNKEIYEMFVTDYIILNRDRHGANMEVLINQKNKTVRLAPLFDHGLSLLAPCNRETTKDFDVLEDKPINSYFGSRSSKENLNLIPKKYRPKIKQYDSKYKEELFKDLDGVVDQLLLDKIWEMISKRWSYYNDFCN